MKKVILILILIACVTGWVWPDFPNLAQTPYARNHANPESNDSIPIEAPTGLRRLWHSLDNYSFYNPCTSGPEGNIYCSGFKDPALGQCNLVALEYVSGEILWTDADSNGGACLLDAYTFVNSPLVDAQGNIYTSDSQRIVSYASDGIKRWENDIPLQLTALSGSGRVNNAFGFNVLTTGELVTATLGDAYVLVMDPDDGTLYSEAFDLPGEKLVTTPAFTRPAGHLEKFGGVTGADAVWDASFADAGNENDNDVSVDKNNNIFIISAAEGPNDLCEDEDPGTACGDGKLWVLKYDPNEPGLQKVSILFSIRTLGPGGSATTPAVSGDGNYVVFANANAQMVVADIPACLAQFAGTPATAVNSYNECQDYSTYDLNGDLLASTTITPDNVIMLLSRDGVTAVQIDQSIGGPIVLTEKFIYGDDLDSLGNPADEFPEDCGDHPCGTPALGLYTNASSVITAFTNVTYFAYSTIEAEGLDPVVLPFSQRLALQGDITPGLVAIDTDTGDEVSVIPFLDGAGDMSNVTMAADNKTLLSNNFNFLTQIARDRNLPLAEQRGAGVDAWVPVRTEEAVNGEYLDISGNQFDFKAMDVKIVPPSMGGPEDPQLHGASLKVFNPVSREIQEIGLPKENWSFVASPEGYVYTDLDQSEGPCTQVLLGQESLEASCGGANFTFSLDETSQGGLGVAFGISPSQDECAYFGGTSLIQDIPGEFHAGPSPLPPAGCGDPIQSLCIIPR